MIQSCCQADLVLSYPVLYVVEQVMDNVPHGLYSLTIRLQKIEKELSFVIEDLLVSYSVCRRVVLLHIRSKCTHSRSTEHWLGSLLAAFKFCTVYATALSTTLHSVRESVDSLCRDGADTPIVRVHRKAFLTRERSRSKPFWAPGYSIPAFLYPTIPPK